METSLVGPILADWSRGTGPLHERLAGAIRTAASRGEIEQGSRLPAERDLARLLGLSRGTVAAAYASLEAEGLLDRRQGSGTRIRAGGRNGLPSGATGLGLMASLDRGLQHRAAEDGVIALQNAYFDPNETIPRTVLAGAAEALLELSSLPGYYPAGYPPLRELIAAHFSGRGLPTAPEQILVTCGAQQAIHLVASAYVHQGDTVVLEDPTYHGSIDVFVAAGGRLLGVPARSHSVDVETVRKAVVQSIPSVVYLMPTFHNPTGGLMAEHHREQLAQIARETQTVMVDDETVALLGIECDPPKPLAAFAPNAPILTIGSLSKVLWPGLRVGWIRGPEPMIVALTRHKLTADLGGSVPSQALAARFFPLFEETVTRRRREATERRNALMDALAEFLPEWSFDVPKGGLSLWARMPAGSLAEEFAPLAMRHGVAVLPGPLMSPGRGGENCFRLPFGLPPEQLRTAVQRLADAWREYRYAPHGTAAAINAVIV